MTEAQFLQKLGTRIKKLRIERGITLDDMGIAMSLDDKLKEYDKSNVSRLEAGKLNPRVFTLYRVSRALDVSVKDLLDLD